MAVRLTARCYTNWTAGIFWKRFLLRRKGISFNHNKEKHLNDSWSLLATIFKLRWRKFLSLFQGFSLPKKKLWLPSKHMLWFCNNYENRIPNLRSSYRSNMKRNLDSNPQHTCRLKVWCSTNWADQTLLEISFLSGGNRGSPWTKKIRQRFKCHTTLIDNHV